MLFRPTLSPHSFTPIRPHTRFPPLLLLGTRPWQSIPNASSQQTKTLYESNREDKFEDSVPLNASRPELELEVEVPAANLTPNKQNPGLCKWFMATHNACLSSVGSL